MSSRGTYTTTRRKYGHTVRFDGGAGYANIDVVYDGHAPVDIINMYDYATGKSEQTDRAAFVRAVDEYMADLDEHDAREYALTSAGW